MQPWTMKTAFSVWDNRIAPVFDTARHIHIVDFREGHVIKETEAVLPQDSSIQKILSLVELGIHTLVCGAITQGLQASIASYGIEVIPFVAGDLREVAQAWMNGVSVRENFAMPGCCGGRHRHGRRVARSRRVHEILSYNQWNETGRGRFHRGIAGMDSFNMDKPLNNCVCPRCGWKEPHQQGVPCSERICPKCGSAMIRE